MRHAAEFGGFVAGARIDIDANAGEVARQSLGRDTDAIRKSRDLVELDGVLRRNFSMALHCGKAWLQHRTFSSARTVAKRLEAHAGEASAREDATVRSGSLALAVRNIV